MDFLALQRQGQAALTNYAPMIVHGVQLAMQEKARRESAVAQAQLLSVKYLQKAQHLRQENIVRKEQGEATCRSSLASVPKRQMRPRGRPRGSTVSSVSKMTSTFYSLQQQWRRRPTQDEVANELGIERKTIWRAFKRARLIWPPEAFGRN